MQKINRRNFMGLGLSAGAVLAFPTPSLLAARGANDKVRLGGIGCGWRGGQLLDSFKRVKSADIVAFADPDSSRLEDNRSKIPNAKGYSDLRKLLDDPNIDAVYVATCNHWHALAAIWAMQAGKDVYVEKPLALTQWEGQQIVNAARKYKKICQVGTQQRSDPMQAEIKKFLHEEKALGNIISARVNRYGIRKPIGKRSAPLVIPSEVDYNLWLGPSEDLPLYRDALHYDWHWVWNTGSGEMGNWGVHVMDDAKNIIIQDKVALPLRIMGGGGRIEMNDAGETPNVHFVYLDTGSIPLVIGLSNVWEKPGSKSAGKHPGPDSGYIAYCEGGTFEGQRGQAVAYDKDKKVIRRFKGDSGGGHQRNFIEAVLKGDSSMLNAEVAMGNAITGWCNLANIVYRIGGTYSQKEASAIFGKTDGRWEELLANMGSLLGGNSISMTDSKSIRFSPVMEIDAATGTFKGENAEKANALLTRSFRKSFEVPEIK